MNVCEYCGEDFPNITELYRHKYRIHQRQSIALHSHKESMDKGSMDIVPYEPNQIIGEKRKRDDIDSHISKRYRELPEPPRRIAPARRKAKREFYQVETPEMEAIPFKAIEPSVKAIEPPVKAIEPANQVVEPANQVVEPVNQIDPVNQIESKISTGNLINYKEYYEKCRAELETRDENFKQQISKVRKECGQDIIKIKKKFKKRELTLKKELASQKDFYDRKTKELEIFHEKNIAILKDKIQSTASFKPLSDAIFNCTSIEEILKIKGLLKQHDIDQIIENHLDTIQKLFLSLSYGVIPICQPQRDMLSNMQKQLIEQIETSSPEQVKELLSKNKMEIINIFSIIEQSIKLATDSYKKFIQN